MKKSIWIKIVSVLALVVTGTCVKANSPQRDTMTRKTDAKKAVLLKKGDIMPNYEFKDVEGKRVSLKKFRGKYVYIDIWATWCGACVEQTPYFEELEERFHNKNIVFVCVSVDKHREAWLRTMKAEKKRIPQWICPEGEDTPLLADFGVVAIPRFILLDKKGRILDVNFSMPSEPQAEKTLSELEGI